MSLLLAVVGQHRVIAGADSRRSDENGEYRDDVQKLFQAGKHCLCGLSGICNLGQNDWIETRVASLCADAGLQDSPKTLLSAIRENLYPPLARLFAEDPYRFAWLLPDSEIIFGAFALYRAPNSKLDLVELRFPISSIDGHPDHLNQPTLDEPELDVILEDHVPQGPIGYCLGSYAEPSAIPHIVQADLPDAVVIRQLDDVFQSAQGTEVGPLTDIAAIDLNGFGWLRSKPAQ
jgi:hypothetical protein